MKMLFDLRKIRNFRRTGSLIGATSLGVCLVAAGPAPVAGPVGQLIAQTTAAAFQHERVLLRGTARGSYFWDDASGRQGDTGLPAIGKPMQKGLFASPSWPLGTEGYVFYDGKKAKFFIGDRGPGVPSDRGVMLDIDGKTFAELTDSTWDSDTLTVSNGMGHIVVDYVVTRWGSGPGRRGTPVPFSQGAWKS